MLVRLMGLMQCLAEPQIDTLERLHDSGEVSVRQRCQQAVRRRAPASVMNDGLSHVVLPANKRGGSLSHQRYAWLACVNSHTARQAIGDSARDVSQQLNCPPEIVPTPREAAQ
jgi:hypothetical protein